MSLAIKSLFLLIQENNPWRPIASEAFEEILTPPWLREKPHAKEPELFHFSRLKRKEDLMKYRKQRRRQWMSKAYMIAKAGTADKAAVHSTLDIDSNAFNLTSFDLYSKSSDFYREAMPDLNDIPDEDILKWSQSLDFDDYANEWMASATSLPSDATFSSLYESSTSQRSQSIIQIPQPKRNPNNYYKRTPKLSTSFPSSSKLNEIMENSLAGSFISFPPIG